MKTAVSNTPHRLLQLLSGKSLGTPPAVSRWIGPLVGLMALVSIPGIAQLPGVYRAELIADALAGVVLIALGPLQSWGYISDRRASSVLLVLAAGILLSRVVMLFMGPLFDDPSRSFFMAVFAQYVVFYLLLVMLLPYPQSGRVGVAAWLILATITTLGTQPYWQASPPRPMLPQLLVYVWLGHGLFIGLMFSWARQQKHLLDQQIALTHREAVARQAREISEIRFRGVFDQVAAGIGLFGPDGRWQEVNSKLCELLGYRADELLGAAMTDVTLAEDHAPFQKRLAQLIRGPALDYSVERRAVRKDGTLLWLLVQMRRFEAMECVPVQGVLFAIDITQRKLAEAQSLEHQRIRDFHFENTPLAIIEWSPDLRVINWPKRAEQLFGWQADEVMGRSLKDWQFVYQQGATDTREFAATLIASPQQMATRLSRNYCKDGSIIWCQWHNSILRDTSGAPISIFTVATDVTAQQQALEALHESEARFRSIFEQAAVGIAMLEADGRWNSSNQRFREMVGYSEAELVATSCQSMTHADDRPIEVELRQRVLSGEQDDYTLEKRYLRKNGEEVWVSLFVRRIDATNSSPVRLVLVAENIGQRKLAEQRLQQLKLGLEQRVSERTRQLEETMRDGLQRNTELALLNEMMSVLPSARDTTEAGQIIGRLVPRLFGLYGGAIWLYVGDTDCLTLLNTWGRLRQPPTHMSIEDCWGLRRGQMHRVEDPDDPLHCAHTHYAPRAQEPHVCLPLIALGVTIGMIHLQWSEHASCTVKPPAMELLRSTAEQIGLAIGNVHLREKLRSQAIRDPLTGLYNRRHFNEFLTRRLAEAVRSGRSFGLLMIDLDHFKSINDTYGHDAGDEVLRSTATLLQQSARADEAVFRLGGEEFLLVLNDGDETDLLGCGERLRRELEAHRRLWNNAPLPTVTASLGLARYPQDGRDEHTLMLKADAALYTAKRTGRNRVCGASTLNSNGSAVISAVISNREPRLSATERDRMP